MRTWPEIGIMEQVYASVLKALLKGKLFQFWKAEFGGLHLVGLIDTFNRGGEC